VAARLTGSRWFWSLAVASLFALPLVRSIGRQLPPPPPVYADLPDFRLVDQEGQAFGLPDLRGRVWVANFIFTSCGEVCPRLTQRMADLQSRLRNVGDAARLVSFTVDPVRDTPPVLREYAQRYHARQDFWKFLTGPLAEIEQTVVAGFKVAVERSEVGDTGFFDIVHGERFVLVDQEGRIRGYYSADDEGLQELLNQLGLLANLGPRASSPPAAMVSSLGR
jgi:protein SCO1/2